MKKKDLFTYVNILNIAYPLWKHNKFRQAILENIEFAKPELEKLEKMQKEDREPLKAHDEQHNPLIIKYGKEIPERKGYFLAPTEGGENYAAYMEEYEPIKEEYAAALATYEKKVKKFQDEILNEEIKLKIYPVSIEFVPDDLPDDIFAYLVQNKIIQN